MENPLRKKYRAMLLRTYEPPGARVKHSVMQVQLVQGLDVTPIGEYEVPSWIVGPFEPFAQGDREFALYCPMYDRVGVMSLPDCKPVWVEPEWNPESSEEPPEGHIGFCPTEFYAPVTDPRQLREAEPYVDEVGGRFAFMTGCFWGVESWSPLWYIDLSDLQRGSVRITRPFGDGDTFLPLAQVVSVWGYRREEPRIRVNFSRTYDLRLHYEEDPETVARELLGKVRGASSDPEALELVGNRIRVLLGWDPPAQPPK